MLSRRYETIYKTVGPGWQLRIRDSIVRECDAYPRKESAKEIGKRQTDELVAPGGLVPGQLNSNTGFIQSCCDRAYVTVPTMQQPEPVVSHEL